MTQRKTKQQAEQQQPKKLTLVDISKEHKKIDQYVEVILLDGKYTVKVAKTFMKSKIQRFLLDLQDALLVLESEKVNTQDVGNMFIIYQMCLLKQFTDLPLKHLDMSKKRDVSKMLTVANQLLDLGVLEEIIKAIPENEMKKIEQVVKEVDQIGKQFGEMLASATFAEQEKLKELGLDVDNTSS